MRDEWLDEKLERIAADSLIGIWILAAVALGVLALAVLL